MTLSLRFPVDAARHPGRHEVVDALLESGGRQVPVVVKKVPVTLRQRLAGRTKGERSLAIARRLLAIGVDTPEPFGVERHRSESWYVCRKVEGAIQIREWFLRRDDPGRAGPELPARFEEVVAAVARLARRMHDGGVFFRDFTDGNVLVTREGEELRLWLVDLDRARIPGARVGLLGRLRDLSRLGLNRAGDRKLLLDFYFAGFPPAGIPVVLTVLRHRILVWDALKRTIRPWKR